MTALISPLPYTTLAWRFLDVIAPEMVTTIVLHEVRKGKELPGNLPL